MRVVLGKFARTGIETQLGADLDEGVRAALVHYTRRLKSKWTPLAPPYFSRGQAYGGPAEEFELSVEAETEAALVGEARRHQVHVDEILAHAVLTYLADLDAASSDDDATLSGAPFLASPASDTSML